jgi:hypothetical protein
VLTPASGEGSEARSADKFTYNTLNVCTVGVVPSSAYFNMVNAMIETIQPVLDIPAKGMLVP